MNARGVIKYRRRRNDVKRLEDSIFFLWCVTIGILLILLAIKGSEIAEFAGKISTGL